jgi:PHD/YefM family antitoxin component YafN of YafNO toxin-antitoxin module
MINITTVSELRRELASKLELAKKEGPLLILSQGQKSAFLVDAEPFEDFVKDYELLQQRVEDLEDLLDAQIALEEFEEDPSILLSMDELRAQLEE